MDKKLTVTLVGRRYEALAYQLKLKNETVEQAMNAALIKLYEKQVPSVIRDFVEYQIAEEQLATKGGKDHG